MSEYKVFMSYSWKDASIATRLYNDLVKSQLKVWRDQIDGDPIDDFKKEFLQKIEECDYFLMLDSVNYRNKSKWCSLEVEKCMEMQVKRNGWPRMIVCLIDEDGDWRWNFKDEKTKALFSKINMLKYQDLCYRKYDDERKYDRVLNFICDIFDLNYRQWNQQPAIQDFFDELGKAGIGDDTQNVLVWEYKLILHLINTGCANNIDMHFKLWIEDCDHFNKGLFFPRWTYAVWLGSNMHNGTHDADCLEQFKSLVSRFQSDPRAHRGYASIANRSGDDITAIRELLVAYELIKRPENARHRLICEYDVLCNLGQLCINLQKYEEALRYSEQALILMDQKNIFNKNLVSNILFLYQQFDYPIEKSTLFLENQLKKHVLESELYKELGLVKAMMGCDIAALECFEKAYMLQPQLETYFYILVRKMILGTMEYSKKEIESKMQETIDDVEDDYWRSAICEYILN